jgi:hypothetical protein
MSGTERGLQGLLAASCLARCPIPFECAPQKFEGAEGGAREFRIVAGQGKVRRLRPSSGPKRRATDPEEQDELPEEEDDGETPPATRESDPTGDGHENAGKRERDSDASGASEPRDGQDESEEVPTFDREISVANRTIDSGDDDEFTEDIIAISEHLRGHVTLLYDCQVMDMTLKFGVIEDGHQIYLLGGSVATTTNGFTKNLFEEIPGGDVALTEFITEQLQSDWDTGRVCVTKGAKCLRADYKCPKMFVILYGAHERFPTVNEARLYRVLKARIQAIEPGVRDALVNVCISCLHVYTAEQRIY